MIFVTGTMRSGTSLWMQVLIAAGFPHIGAAFPKPWGRQLQSANPRGFYESELVLGVHAGTNPHPETGAYLFPEQTREHVVKVFVPGLIRSDVAFMDRVVATVRSWREVAASMDEMKERTRGSTMRIDPDAPSPLIWWMENFALVRDLATRRYAAHVTTYQRLLDDPESEIGTVLQWIGRGSLSAAASKVEASLKHHGGEVDPPHDLESRHVEVFDELYDAIHRGRDLSPSFVERLNRTDLDLRPRLQALQEEIRMDLVRRLAAVGEV
jgi:hypothetical protein